MVSAESQLHHPERRTQSRILIQIPITIRLPESRLSFEAISHDLSWGGVLFTLTAPPPEDRQLIRVELPWRRGEAISADAIILRSSTMSDGGSVVAARFVSLSFANQTRLERLLKALKATAAPRDCSGPGALVRELEVDVQEASEMQRMLGQIASGCHRVTVFETYAVGQSICLSVGGMGSQPILRLRARVVESQKAHMQGFGWAQPYDLTLAFEHPHEAVELIVKRLQGTLDTAPEEASVLPPVPATPPNSEDRCALEERFPELLKMIASVWVDAHAFQQLAADLLSTEGTQPGGWPHDVWDELTLLRSVHAQAFNRAT